MKMFALVVAAGLASSANALVVTSQPMDVGTFGERDTPVFQSLSGSYAAFAATSGLVGFDDYVSTESGPTFLLSKLVFVGGVATAGDSLTFNFYDSTNTLAASSNVTLPTAGNFIWTITFGALPSGDDSVFAVPSAGTMEIVATAPVLGRWFLNSAGYIPTVGSENAASGAGSGIGRNQAFQLNAVPTPGAAALLGLGGLVATRRRR